MSVPFVSLEGHGRTYSFLNADVSIPTLSTGLLADDDNSALFEKDGGDLYHKPSGENIHFFRMYGVYFFIFKKGKILSPPTAPVERHQRFQAGAAA